VDHTSLAILLSLAASLCTATSSVCQRLGAAGQPRPSAGGFDPLLVFRLATRPVWLLGFAGMLAGFACQITALHFGPLALVQPILAVELLFVFGYLEVRAGSRPGVAWRDWLAAAAMSSGVAVFLLAASPSGGRPHAPAIAWWIAGAATVLVVSAVVAASRSRPAFRMAVSQPASKAVSQPASQPTAGGAPEAAWRAACLGIATGISWGFVAAVIKELSAHLAGGPAAIFSTWSVYALMVTGAAAMLLTAHAMAAGPLAASQPGFTIFDPVTATVLGVLLYGEQVRTAPLALTGEVLGLVALAIGARTLTRSPLLTPRPPGVQPKTACPQAEKPAE
jgi:drug/metabolite transporter (DMT)-like permease